MRVKKNVCNRFLSLVSAVPFKVSPYNFTQCVHCWKHYWNFLVSHVGWSGTVPEFQGLPGNYALIVAISFSKMNKSQG